MSKNRIDQIRQKMKATGVDGLLISNFFNILYLSGIQTLTPEEREAFIFITPRNCYYFTDGRYVDNTLLKQIKEIGAVFKLIEMGKGLSFHLKEIIETEKIKKIGFEEEDLKYIEFSFLQKKLEHELIPVPNLVLDIREIKTKEEIGYLKKACSLTDQCLRELLPLVKVGMKEKELAWKMEVWIREMGFELAFEPIVAVNEHAAIPHYNTRTGNGGIKPSAVLMLDFGVRYHNYNADITRMIFIGNQSDQIVNTYNTLASAQEKAITLVQKEKPLEEIDLFCREHLQKHKLPDFSHSTGHGIGLEVHENPKVSKNSKDTVKPGQVFTIEPGVYLNGKYGMRVEDTVYINEKYQAIPLTQFPKNFLKI